MVFSQKSFDCAHGINRKAELKKKKRTRKATEKLEARGLIMEMILSFQSVENLFHVK